MKFLARDIWTLGLLCIAFLAIPVNEATGLGFLSVILIVVAMLAVPFGFWFFVWEPRMARKRTERFQQVAQDLKLTFIPQRDTPNRLQRFHLVSRGDCRGEIRNMIQGKIDDAVMGMFDYHYWITDSRGENSSTTDYEQSVIYFRSRMLNLPHFDMRPEGLSHKIGSAFGYQDIDFQAHPHFSKKYLLRGDDESRIRDLFNDEVLTLLETQNRISVEAYGDQFILYRAKKRIRPDAVQLFMQEGTRLLALFRRRSSSQDT